MAYIMVQNDQLKTKVNCSSSHTEKAKGCCRVHLCPMYCSLDGSTVTELFNTASHIHWALEEVCATFWLEQVCSSSGFSFLSCDFFLSQSLPCRRSWTFLHKDSFQKIKMETIQSVHIRAKSHSVSHLPQFFCCC